MAQLLVTRLSYIKKLLENRNTSNSELVTAA